jgi:hypothetical protein
VNFVKATRQFEQWLGSHTPLVKRDLRLKHQRMAEGVFPFLRATFYRWVQVWPGICAEASRAPRVLAVGDLHIENFGTWRDSEGRLIWGINDFDEAALLPYSSDLIRLATSALLAIEAGHLALKNKQACGAILEGYRESLQAEGRPFVLEEENKWLRKLATGELRNPVHFWEEMDELPPLRGEVPASARAALESLLPEPGLEYRIARSVAGLGSLGRMRFVAIAECHGGRIAREAKALVPSSVYWATQAERATGTLYQSILNGAVRAHDPFVRVRGRWIVRRLSPHCCRVELSELPQDRDELRLLFAMGWETANIHQGSKRAVGEVSRHLNKLKGNWLSSSAKAMARAVLGDWRAWRSSGPS